MQISDVLGRQTVGREDRVVRACIALSLLLMAGFAVVASRGLGFATLVFVLIGLYFAVTAASGRDPLYDRFDIDTHSDVASDEAADAGEAASGFALLDVVDLRTPSPMESSNNRK